MIKNHITIAWRNLTRNAGYSIINISGLAMGMAVAILIGLWVNDELSFNKSFANRSRIGMVYHHLTFGDDIVTTESIPYPFSSALKNNYAEFQEVVMTTDEKDHIVSHGEFKFSRHGFFVSPQFIEMFSLNMLQGSSSALKEIRSIVLSKTLADALVGDNAVGKMIRLDNRDDVMITGVFKDFPRNSQFSEIKMLMPVDLYFTLGDSPAKQMNNWEDYSFQCFFLLTENASFSETEQKIKHILFQNSSGDGKSMKPEGILHPMEKWHHYSEFKNGKTTNSKIQMVWMIGMVGVFVLLLACINFMNLSTARSEKRSREVGVRKVMGSGRGQLVKQFLSESMMMVVFGFLMAIGLVVLCLPWFNELAGKAILLPWNNLYFAVVSIAVIILTSLVAGSYPALYLSSFNPVRVLKGTFKAGRFALIPRKIMVIFQFTISTALIIGTIIVFRQIQLAKDRPLGFDRENIIYIRVRTDDLAKADYNSLRNDLLVTGAVENMAKSDFPITGSAAADGSLTWEGQDPANHPLIALNHCSHDFPKTNGFQFVEGRDFSREFITDSSAVIVNEMAAKIFSDKSAVGKKVQFGYPRSDREIIGVIKDQIRWAPLQKQSPHIYYLAYRPTGHITIRIKPEAGTRAALSKIEAVLKKYDPGAPFDYTFIDDDYAKLFHDEERVGKLAGVFAGLAIFISCLGIFGLASFAAGQRTKEIGIRKVLGASIFSVWKMLSRDFVWLVLASVLLSTPLTYYYASQWLEQYDYRTEISWWIFAVTGIGALAITLLTVSYQAIKAAVANPVESLRAE